jgi:hypothetical protein
VKTWFQAFAFKFNLYHYIKSGWSAAARRTPGGGGGGGPHARRLAAELRHFVAALHEHVVARVLHSAWRELVGAVVGLYKLNPVDPIA